MHQHGPQADEPGQPLDEPALLVEGQHAVGADVEPPAPALSCVLQEPVHHSVELHQPEVLAEVVARLQHYYVRLAVRP